MSAPAKRIEDVFTLGQGVDQDLFYPWAQGLDAAAALPNNVVLGVVTTLPAAASGDRYLIGAGGTGAAAGQDHKIAVLKGATWVFYPVATGVEIRDLTTGNELRRTAGGWDAVTAPGHSHAQADIVGLVAALAAKAALAHVHAIADVTGLQAALDGKALGVHSHALADVTGLVAALDAKAALAHTHALADVTGLVAALAAKAALAHVHAIADVTGLQAALDAKAALAHVHATADVTGLDAALAGKSAVGHGHLISDVLNLQLALDGKALAVHGHAIADVTGLSAALTNKSDVGHGHVIADTAGLQAALDAKGPAIHTHAVADVTGLSAALTQRGVLINGNFYFNQRVFAGGALAAGVYGFDRWRAGAAGCNISVAISSGKTPTVTLTSGQIEQAIDMELFGDPSGVAYVASVEDLTGGDLLVEMLSNTGTFLTSGTITAGAGQRSVAIPSHVNISNRVLRLSPVSNPVSFKNVKLEKGGTATPYVRAPDDLELCQRYYQKAYQLSTAPGAITNAGRITGSESVANTTKHCLNRQLAVRMRTQPTVTWYSPNTGAAGFIRDLLGGVDEAVTSSASGDASVGAPVTGAAGSGNKIWAAFYTASAEL